ncbi:hypothetical protein B0H19DRAFT_1116120 [Mycena capillaripes]|nr:hypothetical protein B0H19DRAFT_1116120 [Mycena capillaripes]
MSLLRRARPVFHPLLRHLTRSGVLKNQDPVSEEITRAEAEPTSLTSVLDAFSRDRAKERRDLMQEFATERKYWIQELSRLQEKVESYASSTATQVSTISALQIEVQKYKNNLNIRSAIEIVAEILRLLAPNTRLGRGVQIVVNAVNQGIFDGLSPGPSGQPTHVRFGNAQADVIAAVTAGRGVAMKDVAQAMGRLYDELSKHHHGGVTEVIEMHHGEQTVPEAIAALSMILFARRRFACTLDVVYTDGSGTKTILSLL